MKSIDHLTDRLEVITEARNLGDARFEPRTCEKHGDYQARHLFGTRFAGCPECRKEREAQEEREKQEAIRAAREAALWATIGRAGIPERFMEKTLKNYVAVTPEQKRALSFAERYAAELPDVLEKGRSAIFLGKPGTGKSHLACAIGQVAIREHKASVLFVTVMRAMRSIKDTWVKGSDVSESQAIEALVAPDLLILDEVGVQFGSDFEKNTMFDVLNERYERRRPTIFLSNLTKDEIAGFLGERVMDRIREDGGKIIPFTWDSHRKLKQEGSE